MMSDFPRPRDQGVGGIPYYKPPEIEEDEQRWRNDPKRRQNPDGTPAQSEGEDQSTQ